MTEHNIHHENELRKLLATDPEGNFELLVEEYQGRLRRAVLNFSEERENVDDIVQDTFCLAFRAIRTLSLIDREGMRYFPWLVKIARNVWLQSFRKKELPTISIDNVQEREEDTNFELEDTQTLQPEKALEQLEQREELQKNINRLPQSQRAALLLRYMQELSEAEIAKQLHQPLGTIKTNIHRAKKTLRNTYRELNETITL